LVVRSPLSGRIVSADPERLIGAFVREGQGVCRIVNDQDLRVAALLEQQEAAWHYDLGSEQYGVELRLISTVDRVFKGRVEKVVEAGQRELPHASLGFAGGGSVQTDQAERSGLLATNPQFVMHVLPIRPEAGGEPWPGLPGERVRLRFSLPDKPYLHQWIDRLHKLVQGKLDI